MRHPSLLLLFVTFSGILVVQYPTKTVILPSRLRIGIVILLLGGLITTSLMFQQEMRIVDFERNIIKKPFELAENDFTALVQNQYSSYRILHNAIPFLTSEALRNNSEYLALFVIPYSEKLTSLEGEAYQWYDLSRLYLRVSRLEDARLAIRELRPTDNVIFEFLHHLNILKASKETGRPVEYFYPAWIKPIKINYQDLKND